MTANTMNGSGLDCFGLHRKTKAQNVCTAIAKALCDEYQLLM